MSQNPSFIPKSFLPIYFRALSQNPSFISKSFFYHYISVHCPQTQALSLKVFSITFPYIVPKPKLYQFFTIIFPYSVPKPKLYLYKFFLPTIIFPYIVPKSKLYLCKFFYHYIYVHCPKTRAKPGVPASC